MNTLLIPTDYSTVADNALTYALEMATHYNLDIALIHVVQLSTPSVDAAIYIDVMTGLTKENDEKMEKKIEVLKKEYPTLTFQYKVEAGLFIDSIHNYCEEINPVAIVMGISGDGSGLEKIIGSNAITAMKTSPYPMIVVPKHGSFKSIEKMCFACDLQNVASSTPLLSIKAFSKLFNSKVDVLNIDFHNRHFTPKTPDEIDALNLMFDNIDHEFHFIESENVQDAINDFIDKNQIDMLIMMPKKHSFFESLFKKSQTKEMLYTSHIPILALHSNLN